MQTFEYPNLVSGTDKWTDWWTPEVGKENSTFKIATIALPRPIEQDDTVCVSICMEFDKLDLTVDKSSLAFQGAVDHSWHFVNPFTTRFRTMKHGVFDGAVELSATFPVDSFSYSTGADTWIQSPVGHSIFEFGLRADYCGGGSLRARRLMVELNTEGQPHAWAPPAGEVWP